MSDDARAGAAVWADAVLGAALLAVDPALGGACLRARSSPAQQAWLDLYQRLAPDRRALRLPPGIGDERLFGGLDLAATLAAGRPVMSPGLLSAADDRLLVLPMAERAGAGLAARLGGALDARGGFTLVALDEGAEADETAPAALSDRLAFLIRLDAVAAVDLGAAETPGPEAILAARARLNRLETPSDLAEGLAGAALALGIGSLRAPHLAMLAARAAAALAGTETVDAEAARVAARLVLGPRARQLPERADRPDQPPEAPPDAPPQDLPETEVEEPQARSIPEELLLEAAAAAIPPDLLAQLLGTGAFRGPGPRGGGAGAEHKGRGRGRPAGSLRGHPRDGARLDLIETLRAAAPWQPLRRASRPADDGRVLVRAEDFRVKRAKMRAEKVVIFVVDASGSTALARLAEAKGAIELMLAQAYVARQQVALIAFRGSGADLLLPPTRSLVMTKRRLARLPGGGGTPLAAGLAEALTLARLARGRGVAPYVALLTDGRANVALDGTPGRPQAMADAERMARACRAEAMPAAVIDTATRPSQPARELAAAMGARYLPLPRADAQTLSGALGAALAGAA